MRNVIISFLMSAVFACSQPIDENRMYGTYKWNKGNENMVLSLERDHTYKFGMANDSTGNSESLELGSLDPSITS